MPGHRRLGLELLDQFLLGVLRRMDGKVRQVQEERLVLVPLDEVDRLVGQEVGQVLAGGVLGRRLVAKSKCLPIETIASSKPRWLGWYSPCWPMCHLPNMP